MISIVHKTLFLNPGSQTGVFSIPLSAPSTPGNFLVVVMHQISSHAFDNPERVITTNNGETFTFDNTSGSGSGTSANSLAIFELQTTLAASSINVNATNGNTPSVHIFELSGNSIQFADTNHSFQNTPNASITSGTLTGTGSDSTFYMVAVGTSLAAGGPGNISVTSVSPGSWSNDIYGFVGLSGSSFCDAYQVATGVLTGATFSVSPNGESNYNAYAWSETGGSGSPCGPGMVQLVNGGFQDNEGNLLSNGYLLMQLSQDAQLIVSSVAVGQVGSGLRVRVPLDSNANIQGTPGDSLTPVCIWPNDIMVPSSTFYSVWAYKSNGQLAWGPQNVLVKGASPFDCNTWSPTV